MNNSRLTPRVQKNLMLVVACLWLFSTVAWIIAIALGIAHGAAILQLVLHGFCAVLSAVCSVLNFGRWRKMPLTDETAEELTEDTLDSTEE